MFDDARPAPNQSPEQFFRRRLLIFCGAFLLASVLSLTYVFIRPALYRAVALVEITPPELVAESSDAKLAPGLEGDPKSFLTEVKVLTSRPPGGGDGQAAEESGPAAGLGKKTRWARCRRCCRPSRSRAPNWVQVSAIGAQRS